MASQRPSHGFRSGGFKRLDSVIFDFRLRAFEETPGEIQRARTWTFDGFSMLSYQFQVILRQFDLGCAPSENSRRCLKFGGSVPPRMLQELQDSTRDAGQSL